METNYIEVTETTDTLVSKEQVQRMCNRYDWALPYCIDKDVVEVACGSGQGLGLIQDVAKSIVGGDISKELLELAKNYYGDGIPIKEFSALELPFEDNSKDVIICYEAIYYFPSLIEFVEDVSRVLRKDGLLLISSANKDLDDFNPSPYTHEYYGVKELNDRLRAEGFKTEFFGDVRIDKVSGASEILRKVKKLVVRFDLMPKTMRGKRLLKRLVFGKLIRLVPDLRLADCGESSIESIESTVPNTTHKVILVAARKG